MCTFWYVKPIDVNDITEYTTNSIQGTMDVHCVWFVGPTNMNKLLKNNLACFCCFCTLILISMHLKTWLGLNNGRLRY